ncbi:MAG: hypothetical protein J6K33_03250 [Alistipes sp.]|nr:hypothetical protein [Alistipes sp.]
MQIQKKSSNSYFATIQKQITLKTGKSKKTYPKQGDWGS